MITAPENLIDRPFHDADATRDPLTAVLRSLRLAGGVFLDAQFTAPWCVTSGITAEDCRPLLADPTLLIAYHVVIAGRLWVSVAGSAPIEVRAGEIVLLPRNDEHTVGSAIGLTPIDARGLVHRSPEGGLVHVRHGGGGEPAAIFCGFLGSEDAAGPLLESLPPVLKIDMQEAASAAWIEASVRFAAGELARGRLATSGVLSRLSELLLIEAIRHYAATDEGARSGWLKGAGDPHVGRALALVHNGIATPWSTEDLARAVGMSRSTFTDRFRELVGVPPMRYVTRSRMQTASRLLDGPGQSVERAAFAVGYESAEAFGRAFKREFGTSPGQWRKRRADAADAPAD